MKKQANNRPPQLADRMLAWFCKEEWLEPIKGDLYEQFLEDLETNSPRIAKRKYWINAFLFLRPFATKKMISPIEKIPGLSMIAKPLIRHMKKKPGFYSINILGLALGLTVVFLSMLWIYYHTSFDDFHSKKDRIYSALTNTDGVAGETQTGFSANYRLMEQALEEIPEIQQVTRIISTWRWPSEQCFKIDENKSCIYRKGIYSDSSFFKVFDFKVIAGDPNPLRDPGHIALSESLAKELYGDTNPIGLTYKIDNHFPVTISAVFEDLPPNSSFQFEFIGSLRLVTDLFGLEFEKWLDWGFETYVVLQNDAPKTIGAKINALELMKDQPRNSIFLHPFRDKHLYDQFENGSVVGGLITYINMIRAFSIFILIISVVNFINLTTAHATSRGKEIGVRKIIGAGKGTLKLHFLMEIGCCVLIASIIACISAYFMLPILSRLIDEPIQFVFGTDIMIQMISAIGLTILLSGIYPAFVLSAFKPLVVLKNLQFHGSGNNTSRQVLTIAQVAISTFIILMTLVFYLQLKYMQQHNLGYDSKGIMLMEPTYRHIKQFEAFKNDLLQHPEIENVGLANMHLVNGVHSVEEIFWPGKDPDDHRRFKAIGVDNGLMELLGLTIYEGNAFSSDSAAQVILTRTAAKEIGIENILGTTINIYDYDRRVVGIVEDFKTESLHSESFPIVLYPVQARHAGTFYIRYDQRQPQASIQKIEEVYDRYETFFDIKFRLLDDEYQALYQREQIISRISMGVMVLAVVIALIGILGLSIFNISRKLKEIGLRKIFGASGIQLFGLLSREFIILTIIANVIAFPFAIWIGNEWLESFAYRISFPVIAGMSIFLLSLTTILVLLTIQSLKVTQMNPAKILRDE
ncbi:MAG: FtsX-like permease family protein [Cytophagales bacterium]|nr:FtsX-like permease family protein [Cytophagales bacterium]